MCIESSSLRIQKYFKLFERYGSFIIKVYCPSMIDLLHAKMERKERKVGSDRPSHKSRNVDDYSEG